MEETKDLGKIKEQIQHMLNMTTEKGCTEAEAQVAMEMAQKLLIKYNLQMEEVIAHTDSKDLAMEMCTDFYAVPGNFNWHKYLTHYVAKHNMCKVVLKSGKGQTYGSVRGMRGEGDWKFDDSGYGCYLFGRRANVEATKVMVEWISIQLEYLAVAATRAYNPYEGMEKYVGPNANEAQLAHAFRGSVTSKQQFRNSFLWGAINRINERLYESRKTCLENDPNTKALVLDRDAEAKRYQDEQMDTKHTHRSEQNLDSRGYGAGRDAANTVSFGGSHHIENNGHMRLGSGK